MLLFLEKLWKTICICFTCGTLVINSDSSLSVDTIISWAFHFVICWSMYAMDWKVLKVKTWGCVGSIGKPCLALLGKKSQQNTHFLALLPWGLTKQVFSCWSKRVESAATIGCWHKTMSCMCMARTRACVCKVESTMVHVLELALESIDHVRPVRDKPTLMWWSVECTNQDYGRQCWK